MRSILKLIYWVAAVALIGCKVNQPKTSPNMAIESTASESRVYTQDIDNFWEAYDAITATSDPEEQLILLNDLYIDRGSPGLHAMIRARSYRSHEYLQAINDYPNFWSSVRMSTLNSADYSQPISEALNDMKIVYPDGKDVPVYFVIGALRAGGTANDNKLLIGAELAMAGLQTPSHEFSEPLSHLESYFANNPISGLIDLNLHEYVHTQQRSVSGNTLLSQALFEGVAEYISTHAVNRPSVTAAITYGVANHDAVIAAFEKDILKDDFSEWIWNSPDNEFGVRDLGYYVGYVIAERYVSSSENTALAIKTLIELDYQNSKAVEAIVDKSRVFPKSILSYGRN